MVHQHPLGIETGGPDPPARRRYRSIDGEKFLSIPLTRDYLAEHGVDLSISTIRRHIREGRLRTVVLGRRVFVPRSAIAELLQVGEDLAS